MGASLGSQTVSQFLLEFTRSDRANENAVLPQGDQEYHVRGRGRSKPDLATLRWSSRLHEQLERLREHTDDAVGETAAQVGRALADFLDVPGWATPAREIAAKGETEPVALTLRSNAAELYLLPWELLSVAEVTHAGSLSRLLLRYEWPDSVSAPRSPGLSPTKPGRVIFAWSAAGGKVDAARHVKLIEKSLDDGKAFFDDDRERPLDVIENASCDAIDARLKRAASRGEPVAVLHLLCHGGSDDEGTFGLALNDGDDPTERDLVGPSRLQAVLRKYAGLVRLVVISACDGGNAGPVGHQLGSVAQALHKAGFGAVIASRFPLSWDGARTFATALYDALLRELTSLEDAFLAARAKLSLRGTLDWASLQLYAREADGDATYVFNARPYRGLAAFAPEHALFFFGRDAEVDELVRDLDALVSAGRPRFLVVAGASGTGKSSMVLAGAIPRLVARAEKAGEELAHLVVRPGPVPAEALARVEERRSALAEGATLVVVVDQFEEVFTHVEDVSARESFVRALWALAREPGSALRVVVTLRIDFLGRCGEVVLDATTGMRLDKVALDHAHQVLVAQMDPAQLREAIEGPARALGLTLEPGLAQRIVQDVGAEPGALPLMSHALYLLWRAREGTTLSTAAYEALGAVQGALHRHAEEQLAALADDAERETARRTLVRLVNPGSDAASDTRRRRNADELRRAARAEGASFERVLDRLVDARLLVTGEAGTVEIAHEALIRNWKTLRGWIDEERASLVQVAQVEAWASDWKKSPDALLVGSRLGYAEEVAGRRPDDLSADAHAFIAESRAAQERAEAARRREEERLRATIVRAHDHALMAAAREAVNDPTTQVALLREVQEPERVRNWEEAACAALVRKDAALALFEHEGRPLTSADFSPDGTRAVSASEDGTVRVWRADGVGEPVILRGHEGEVFSASFSSDGTRVVTACEDKTARVWSADGTGEPVILQGHAGVVRSASFSPDGARVVTACDDGMARVWRADGLGEAVTLEGHESGANFATFSPDGSRVVITSWGGTARVWSADGSGEPVTLEGHESAVRFATFSPDGTRVVTACDDGLARVWRTDGTGEPVVLRGHGRREMFSATFSPDGSRVVTASADKTARVWRVDGVGEPVVLRGHDEALFSARFSPDGTRVVTACDDKTARVWRADGVGEPLTLQGHEGGVRCARFSPDGTRVITASQDGTARVWRAVGARDPVVLRGHEGGVLSTAFSPDGTRVVTASEDKTARVWRADGAGEPVILRGHEGLLRCVTFSPDGTRVLTTSEDKTARVWNADGAGEPVVLRGHEGEVLSAAFSPDGSRVVTASLDGTARVWSADGAGDPVVLRGHEGTVISVAFSPDGTRVASTSDDRTARVWRADGAGDPVVLRGHEMVVISVAFSPDGTRVVTASDDGTARVWRADGAGDSIVLRRGEDETHPPTYSASFSPDGLRVVAAAWDGTARVWRADGAGDPIVLRGHKGAVYCVVFSPDGSRVVTASADGTARVWHADGAGEPVVLRGHAREVLSAAFSPDGACVVTASMDGTACVWRWSRWGALLEMLWNATAYCISVQKRMALLGEAEAEAIEAFNKAREEVARRVAAGRACTVSPVV